MMDTVNGESVKLCSGWFRGTYLFEIPWFGHLIDRGYSYQQSGVVRRDFARFCRWVSFLNALIVIQDLDTYRS